ncbi:hypothetical protein CGCA056_v012280 [Colletotrichum aenigma]|uniref:uncharacterized protein n=1 Tax=Colletotrichum aenigma TaxID=1215731 RepID=UPI001872C6BB|nr:uncharacterized protein CGCA056_v012280 [Colletotrichum aenigma]KAF5512928.1 hypothetical protein CGCA056_v012280 [Colletotrichum aenigma]
MKPGPDADDVGATELWCKELCSTFSKKHAIRVKRSSSLSELPSPRARTTWTMVCSGSGSGLDMNPKTQQDLAVYLPNRLISRHASDCEWASWFGRFALGFHDDTSTSWPSCTLEQESGTVP